MSVNKVIILGRLGKDPELKNTKSGVAVCTFSVATSERRKADDGSYIEETEWHNVVAWRKTAEACVQYLTKGSQVYIEGKLKTQSWEQDGSKRYKTEIMIDKIDFLNKKEESQDYAGKVEYKKNHVEGPAFDDDDIPF